MLLVNGPPAEHIRSIWNGWEATELEEQYLSTSAAEVLTRIVGMLQWTMTKRHRYQATFLACLSEAQSHNRVFHSNTTRSDLISQR
jgi:hypothetical protein